jgi:hypothetical protein
MSDQATFRQRPDVAGIFRLYAVALDSPTDELGDEAQILDTASVVFNDTGPIRVATRAREFVTARVTNDAVVLGRVNVR